jgi:hypothetical protein
VIARKRRATTRAVDYGCEFCAHPQNRWFGPVHQVAIDLDRGLVLLQCPRCAALYENAVVGADQTRRLTEEEAEQRFGPLAR